MWSAEKRAEGLEYMHPKPSSPSGRIVDKPETDSRLVANFRVARDSARIRGRGEPGEERTPQIAPEMFRGSLRPSHRKSESSEAQLSPKQLANVVGQRDFPRVAGDRRHGRRGSLAATLFARDC